MSEKSFSYQPLAQSPPPYQEAVVLMPVSKNGQQQPMFLSPVPILCAPFVAMPQTAVLVTHPPQFITPSSHLVLTVVLFIILAVLAPETMFLMVPALILSLLSQSANQGGLYLKAKRLGTGALVLNFISIIVAFLVLFLAVILTFSFHPWRRANDYYAYYGCWYADYGSYEGSGGSYNRPMICS